VVADPSTKDFGKKANFGRRQNLPFCQKKQQNTDFLGG